MNEDDYRNLFPLYMQRLKNRVEKALWETFEESKCKQVGEYIARWHEKDDDDFFWENFTIFERDDHIDLSRTLAGMPNEMLIKMAADLGVDTPGLLPCIPVMKNALRENNQSVLSNFERAVKEVYEHPDQSVALAASTLEGLFKAILQESQKDILSKNDSLSKLTGKVVKELVASCDSSAPTEIKALASQIRGIGCTIDDLRSDKSTAHGKAPGEYIIDDELWAEAVVNATATLGILLWRLHERQKYAKQRPCSAPAYDYDEDIPF